jgi:TPR repeat protein
MLDQAMALLQNGDVASARLLYEHLAKKGSALGALSLAKTYDADVLLGLGVVGMRPDRAEARRWYERAAELGSPEARQRLETLAAGG